MKPKSLKSKLLIAVFALVISSSVFVSLLVAQRYSASLQETATAQAENIANAVSLEATDKILIRKPWITIRAATPRLPIFSFLTTISFWPIPSPTGYRWT